jgi:hypothetical protein
MMTVSTQHSRHACGTCYCPPSGHWLHWDSNLGALVPSLCESPGKDGLGVRAPTGTRMPCCAVPGAVALGREGTTEASEV